MTLEQAKAKLAEYGQEHVLSFYDELSEGQRLELIEQIDQTDFSVIELGEEGAGEAKKGEITPLSAMELPEIEAHKEEFVALGVDAIKAGKVGAVLLAGGMGTRLGSDGPKGVYDIGITKPVYIFQRLIENLQDVVKLAGAPVHLFVMTSDKNHETTVSFFKEKNYFGYDSKYIHFFQQDMAPASDYDGKVFMEAKNKMATSPNGNAGWYLSMAKAGLLDLVHEEKIEWLNVFAVDNVLQRIADPCFVGACIAKQTAVGSKVVRKATPDEKVGVMCLEDGKPSIVEYYELTDELMNAKDAKGDPAYNFGVILNYLFNEKELSKIMDHSLTYHVVEKKIPHIDAQGNPVNPEKPNGHKYEQLVLDMIHEMPSCVPFEVVREYEFAPIKNKEGVDSVDSARKLCEKNGIEL